MIIHFAKIALLVAVSFWASFYIGSLVPLLWRQKNYRGAVGIAALACVTLILPLTFSLLGNG